MEGRAGQCEEQWDVWARTQAVAAAHGADGLVPVAQGRALYQAVGAGPYTSGIFLLVGSATLVDGGDG